LKVDCRANSGIMVCLQILNLSQDFQIQWPDFFKD
jgi:hypothetical protein